jgi:hypothetical protein
MSRPIRDLSALRKLPPRPEHHDDESPPATSTDPSSQDPQPKPSGDSLQAPQPDPPESKTPELSTRGTDSDVTAVWNHQRSTKRRIIPARIPASLFAQVNEARARTGDTHEMWFLAAFDRVYDQLAEQYESGAGNRPSPVPQRRRRARRPSGEPLTQYPLRLTYEEAAALEERAAELEPTSMSEFVTTIVALALRRQ